MAGTDRVVDLKKGRGMQDGSGLGSNAIPLRRRRPSLFHATALCAMAAGLLGLLLMVLLGRPMDVPDTSTLTTSNYQGNVDAGNWIGQSFVARRDNLDEVSLVLATEQRNDYSVMEFAVREDDPEGTVLRTTRLLIDSLPEGNPYDFRPGSLGERWTAFHFAPIPNSAGRTLFFEVSGQYVPNVNKVKALMMFQGKYTQGKGYVNGEGRDAANVVFRSRSLGTVRDYVGVLAENLTARKWGPLASPATYAVLGAAYLILLGVLLWRTRHTLRV